MSENQNLLLEQNRQLDTEVKAALAAKKERVTATELPPSGGYFSVRLIQEATSGIEQLGYNPDLIQLGHPNQKNSVTAGVDLAVNTVAIARDAGKHPLESAQEVSGMFAQSEVVEAVETVGPFVNVRLDYHQVAPIVLGEVAAQGEHYGHFRDGEPKVVLIDYSSPNVAKNMTVAHLRSTIIGHVLTNIHQAAGDVPFGVNHIGDWGSQFGNIIYEYRKELAERGDEFLEEMNADPTATLMRIYRAFNERKDHDPAAVAQARDIFNQLEKGDPELVKLWHQFREWSLRDFGPVYARLGVEFDAIQGESFYEDRMQAAVQDAVDKGVLKTNEAGAVVFPSQPLTNPMTGTVNDKIMLDQEGNPRDELLVKPNQGTVYLTRDLAAIHYRSQELGADRVLYVIGKEQENHCLELFAMADQLGHLALGKALHISFGHLNVDGRKMKSRSGRVVLLKDILDETTAAAENMLKTRHAEALGVDPSQVELSEADKATARQVGIGALTFSDLRQDRRKDIEFKPDFDESVKEGGATYIQYTHARLTRVLERVGEPAPLTDMPEVIHAEEKQIVKQIAQLPTVVAEAAAENAPHKLANYLSALCKSANVFYREFPVLRAESEAERVFRTHLMQAAKQTIQNTANLLHLQLPEKM